MSVTREYALEMVGGHLIIEAEGQALLLDTGSPVSVGRETTSRFQGREFPVLPRYNGMTTESLSETIGARIDALLGADVLSWFTVDIDPETSRVAFGRDSTMPRAQVVPMKRVGGIPVLKIEVAGKAFPALLHTGATVSCLRGADTRPFPFVGIARDCYPGLGEFATELRRVPLLIGGLAIRLVCGVLPPVLEQALIRVGVCGLVGTDLLRSFRVGWSPGFTELHLLARRVSAGVERFVVPSLTLVGKALARP